MGAIVTYQIGAHYTAATPGAHGMGLAVTLLPLLATALVAATHTTYHAWLLPLWSLVRSVLWMARAPLAAHFDWGLYLEHTSFNLMMAYVFDHTLVAGREPLCTRFAHMVHGTLTPRTAHYSRQVTLVQALFFLTAAAVSTLLFTTASAITQSTFANYLSLPLIGVVFVAEYLCCRIVLHGEPHSSLFDAVRVHRQSEQSGRVTPTTTERSR